MIIIIIIIMIMIKIIIIIMRILFKEEAHLGKSKTSPRSSMKHIYNIQTNIHNYILHTVNPEIFGRT